MVEEGHDGYGGGHAAPTQIILLPAQGFEVVNVDDRDQVEQPGERQPRQQLDPEVARGKPRAACPALASEEEITQQRHVIQQPDRLKTVAAVRAGPEEVLL